MLAVSVQERVCWSRQCRTMTLLFALALAVAALGAILATTVLGQSLYTRTHTHTHTHWGFYDHDAVSCQKPTQLCSMYLFFARLLPYAVRETVYSLVFSAVNVIKTCVFTVSVSDNRDTLIG